MPTMLYRKHYNFQDGQNFFYLFVQKNFIDQYVHFFGYNSSPKMELYIFLLFLSVSLSTCSHQHDLYSLKRSPSLFLRPDSFAFTSSQYSVSIMENSVASRNIYVVQDDVVRMGVDCGSLDPNIRVRFRIRSGDDEKQRFFKAESVRVGDFAFLRIRLRSSNRNVLNREKTAVFHLDVRIKIQISGINLSAVGMPRSGRRFRGRFSSSYVMNSKTIVTVNVLDANDLDPYFSQSTYVVILPEDTPLYSDLGVGLKAEDADIGLNGDVYYSFVDTSVSNFALDPVTGSLFLIRPLILASMPSPSIMLKVAAIDRGPKGAFTTRRAAVAFINITVHAVNLHDPIMDIEHLPSIIEHSHTDIYAIIHVHDADVGRHGRISSLEIVEGDTGGHFRIRKSSKIDEFSIELLKLVDRERAPSGYNLTLKVTDDGVPPRSSYANVRVCLSDFNDNSPVFKRKVYKVMVNESAPIGTRLVRLTVSDLDLGRNAKVRFNLVEPKDSPFILNSFSGVLVLVVPLDAETKNKYTLLVTASDQSNPGTRLRSNATIRIFVADVNDNAPDFGSGSAREVILDENEPAGSKVVRLTALDADSDDNGRVTYSLVNSYKVPFLIDAFTGLITTTRLLDFETDRRSTVLLVRASDCGFPYRLQSELRLTVRLRDINDNRPQFERIKCQGRIPRHQARNSSSGLDILTLSAIDLDRNDVVSYRIVSGNQDRCFHLGFETGILKVVCNLDRELPMKKRILNVTATDGRHFADVMVIRMRFIDDWGGRRHFSSKQFFQCRQTDATKRLRALLTLSERANLRHDAEEFVMPLATLLTTTNIHRPEFDKKMPREIQVYENVPPGSLLLKVKAFDGDNGFDGKLYFVISNGIQNASHFDDIYAANEFVFSLGLHDGHLRLHKGQQLDREVTPGYVLNITIYDQGIPSLSSWTLLHVTVLDVNDNFPCFDKSTWSIFLLENSPINTTIAILHAEDADAGINGIVQYSLEEADDAVLNLFSLDSTSGRLTVAQNLDREFRENYDLRIRASDRAAFSLWSLASVRIQLLDVNDVAPVFLGQNFGVKVREDLPVGSVVGFIHAYDADLYEAGYVTFAFEREFSEFTIDALSGAIRLSSGLDFETRQFYNLTVVASDSGQPVRMTSTMHNYIIEVIDVNENLYAPRFSILTGRLSVPENLPAGSIVGSIQATDFDEGIDGEIVYSIRGGSGRGYFTVDSSSGEIRTSRFLDREMASNGLYWLVLFATDLSLSRPLSSKVDICVHVLDVNDNTPVFAEPAYYVNIREKLAPHTSVLTLDASDADLMENDFPLTYTIIDGNSNFLFELDEHSAILRTSKNYREIKSDHVLIIQVQDNGTPQLNNSVRVYVSIKVEQKYRPRFIDHDLVVVLPPTVIKDVLTKSSKESFTSTKIAREIDSDSTSCNTNATSEWTFFKWNITHVKPLLRLLTTQGLAFSCESRCFNTQFGMQLKDSSPFFGIDRYRGVVFALRSLKPSRSFNLTFGVFAGDSNICSQDPNDIFHLVVNTTPSVDIQSSCYHPKISNSLNYTYSVSESEPIGYMVMQTNVTYLSTCNNTIEGKVDNLTSETNMIWFSIISGDNNGIFYLTPDTGRLLIATKLSLVPQNMYNLTISVTDGVHIDRAYVMIYVKRFNHVPQFSKPIYKTSVMENSHIGQSIIQIEISNYEMSFDDSKTNIQFFLQNYHSGNHFAIDAKTGIVTLEMPLDFEEVEKFIVKVSVLLEPEALSNYVHLEIEVIDVNDNRPFFGTFKHVSARIMDTALVGSKVVEVFATDFDKGENGRITYSIVKDEPQKNNFLIDKNLGIIMLASKLEAASVTPEYTLTIRAADNPLVVNTSTTVCLWSTIEVRIQVYADIDESPPKFTSPSVYTVEIYENVPLGSFVLQLKAWSLSTVDFVLNNDKGFFLISPSTGIVITQQFLDFEANPFFNLTASVINHSGQKDWCIVLIHVLDVNDNSPQIRPIQYSGTIHENAPIGTLVMEDTFDPLVIRAFDADSGLNSMLNFSIIDFGEDQLFSIDSVTGAITLSSGVLDYETKNQFILSVSVVDRGWPNRLVSDYNARVVIDLIDVNDCAPCFEKQIYDITISVPLLNAKGIDLIQLKATDPDVSMQNKIMYSITSGNEKGLFGINDSTGHIYVEENSLDLSMNQEKYKLNVSATDGVNFGYTSLKIGLEEIENSGLVFDRDIYHASVLENATFSRVLLVLNVLGSSLSEHLTFRLLRSSSLFNLGLTSGVLSTNGSIPFDREVKAFHRLMVEVRSESDFKRKKARIARVEIIVNVEDVNDNAPVFVNQPYNAVISRNSPGDAPIIRLQAYDDDKGKNGNIFYHLKTGDATLFRVGRKSGQVTLRRQLSLSDYRDQYNLIVTAYDGGSPPHSSKTSVRIWILQSETESRNASPVFTKASYGVIKVPEDIKPSTVILRVEASIPISIEHFTRNITSNDTTTSTDHVLYTIDKGNDERLFDIDFHMGTLFVVGPLDFEKKRLHRLTITAVSSSLTTLKHSSTTVVSIEVTDVNDCIPSFSRSESAYKVNVSEATTVGSEILRIRAFDPDSSEQNGRLRFFFTKNPLKGDYAYFGIRSDSGIIYLKQELDFEKKPLMHLYVTASDAGNPSLASTTMVILDIININDNVPQFVQELYDVEISSQPTRGQFVAKVQAFDADNTKLHYFLLDNFRFSLLSRVFHVEPDTGIIRISSLRHWPQIRRRHHIFFNISVSDGVYTSRVSCLVKISLIPATNYAPYYDAEHYFVDWPENVTPDDSNASVFVASDHVSDALNSSLKYSIQWSSPYVREFFKLNSFSGEISCVRALDREERSSYVLSLLVTDSGGLSDHAIIKINVKDENDNKPYFVQTQIRASIAVTETIQYILRIEAKDLDVNETLIYSLYCPEEIITLNCTAAQNVFEIDKLSGDLFYKVSLRRWQENEVYQFFVRVFDGLHTADVPVEIYVTDVIDVIPTIEVLHYSRRVRREQDRLDNVVNFYVTENGQMSQYLARLGQKLPLAANLTFKIASCSSLSSSKLFKIDSSTGIISIDAQLLDREKQASHEAMFSAETDTSPPLLVYSPWIRVHVIDQNDNTPIFHGSSPNAIVRVAENSPIDLPIYQVKAFDADAGENASIAYFLLGDPISEFTIDVNTGWIRIAGQLDYEIRSVYILTVQAKDGGGLSSKINVTIHLVDLNDNLAVFSEQRYVGSIAESTLLGTHVIQLFLKDADTSFSSPLTKLYIISGNENDHFEITSEQIVVVKRPLDREKAAFYSLKIMATDGFHVTSCLLEINVLDVNDSPPICTQPNFFVSIKENIRPGSFVLDPKASVMDEDVRPWIQHRFAIVTNTENNTIPFTCNAHSGKLRTSIFFLDREAKEKYDLTIRVSDKPGECFFNVHISVLDVNDNAPKFMSRLYAASLKENVAVGTTLTKVSAIDLDGFFLNRQLHYSLGLQSVPFMINPDTGVVSVTELLDREKRSAYNVTLMATDAGVPPLTGTSILQINVLDVNDNPPKFSSKFYSTSLLEDIPIGTDVLSLKAVSGDIGINAQIIYSIVSGNDQGHFGIDNSTGIIKTLTTLDFESSPEYFLMVEAMDGGYPPLSSHAIINISLIDINDNIPTFVTSAYSPEAISEDAPVGTSVVTVQAFDADSGENGLVTYAICRGDRLNQFIINARSGLISIAPTSAQSLDREMISSYVLEVIATDGGNRSSLTPCLVSIKIKDVNDNAPQFMGANPGQIYVSEDRPFGHILWTFSVSDFDDSPNGSPFTFDIRSGNEDNAFRIVQKDATLRSATIFDIRFRQNYNLQIRVFDNGSPPLFNDTFINITVIAASKYAPIIKPLQIEVFSFLDDFPGGKIGQVIAYDQDPHDKIKFSILNHAYVFEIDASDGTLYSIRSFLDVGNYILNVSVHDGKFSTFGAVLVNVRLLTEEMLSAASIIKLVGITPTEFCADDQGYRHTFRNVMGSLLNVRSNQILILAVQAIIDDDKPCSHVFFVVEKVSLSSLEIRNKIRGRLRYIGEKFGIMNGVELQKEQCLNPETDNECSNGGKCVDVVVDAKNKNVDHDNIIVVSSKTKSFVSPKLVHATMCVCSASFTGSTCSIALNKCALSSCPSNSRCYQNTSSNVGYSCVPCQSSTCQSLLGFKGDAFIRYSVQNWEAPLFIKLNFLSYTMFGTLIHIICSSQNVLMVEIIDGYIYVNDAVIKGSLVTDGKWHKFGLKVDKTNFELIIDNYVHKVRHNLSKANMVTIGDRWPSDISKFFGCMSNLWINNQDFRVPINYGDNFTNVLAYCPQSYVFTGCPCQNGGTCLQTSNTSQINCICTSGWSGKRCQHKTLCASNPCLHGGLCFESVDHSGVVCKCNGYVGQFCEVDIDECLMVGICGKEGTCINSSGGYRCICGSHSGHKNCSVSHEGVVTAATNDTSSPYVLRLEEVVGLIGSLFLIVLAFSCFIGLRRLHQKFFQKVVRSNTSSTSDQGIVLPSTTSPRRRRYSTTDTVLVTTQEHLLLLTPTRSSIYDDEPSPNNYTDAVCNYGIADDLMTAAATTATASTQMHQSSGKPTATVAPSVCRQRLLAMDTATDSVEDGRGISPLSTYQRYYWDSFDLSGEQVGSPMTNTKHMRHTNGTSVVGESFPLVDIGVSSPYRTSTLPPPGEPVDPTRDIETLLDDYDAELPVGGKLDDVISPVIKVSNSLEILLNQNDINFADEEADEAVEQNKKNDYNYYSIICPTPVAPADGSSQMDTSSENSQSHGCPTLPQAMPPLRLANFTINPSRKPFDQSEVCINQLDRSLGELDVSSQSTAAAFDIETNKKAKNLVTGKVTRV